MCTCLLLALALAAPPNLCYNGDFELADPQSPPPGYSMWGAGQWKVPANYTRDTDNPHSGSACFRLHHPANTAGYIVTQPDHAVRPKAGMVYEVSFWARSDTSTPARFGFTAYESVNPFKDAPSPGSWALAVGTAWKEFRFRVQEGLDFFVPPSSYLLLTFYPATRNEEAKTLWLDDIQVSELPNPTGVRLVNEATLPVPPIEQRLRPGDRLDVTVDPSRVLRPATRDGSGISFHRVCGWTGQPYDRKGAYTLDPRIEAAIKDLRLPMTRFYGVGDEPFSVEESLDRVAEICRKCGIDPAHTVIELEDQGAERRIAPEVWGRAAAYAVAKGYGFRYWEVGNEVYSSVWHAGERPAAYPTPDDYVTQVKAVAAAIKAVQPDALIGLSMTMGYTRWGNYLLARAAGSYDYVCPHLYSGRNMDGRKFEDVAITDNQDTLKTLARLNALIKQYNPGREVYVYDTEWGCHSSGTQGERADYVARNANTWGMMHRAVRMVYYAREDLLRGASSWQMLNAVRAPGFGILSQQAPDQRFLMYWLYWLFNRHLGDNVVAIDGTAPFHAPAGAPLTPVLATSAGAGRTLHLVVPNASLASDAPCTIRLGGFVPRQVTGTLLRATDADAAPLVANEADVVSKLPVVVDGALVSFTVPAHGVAFVTLTR